MLVLSRKVQQSILLHCDKGMVRVKIVDVGHDRVSIGVEAPADVKILREELLIDESAAS